MNETQSAIAWSVLSRIQRLSVHWLGVLAVACLALDSVRQGQGLPESSTLTILAGVCIGGIAAQSNGPRSKGVGSS